MDILFVTPLQATLNDDPLGHVRENQYRRLRIGYRSGRPFERSLRRPHAGIVYGFWSRAATRGLRTDAGNSEGSQRCIVIATAIGRLCHASWSNERP